MKKVCEECKSDVENGFEFCPVCSAPLTETAKKLEEQKAINAQLVLVAKLMHEIDDEKTLKLLNEIAKKLVLN